MPTKPTEAAIKAAECLLSNYDFARVNDTASSMAQTIDEQCNLPALTAVALAAQGVIDAYDRAHPISRTVSELKHALSKL